MEQRGIGAEDGKVFPEKGFFLDEDADDDDIFLAIFFQGIAAVRLTEVAVAFFHENAVLTGRTERFIMASVGEVYEEEIVAVETFVDVAAMKYADHDFFGRIAQPLRNEFRLSR